MPTVARDRDDLRRPLLPGDVDATVRPGGDGRALATVAGAVVPGGRELLGRGEGLPAINRGRVIAVLNEIAEAATPIQANRCQSLISSVFSWALDEGLIEAHPALRIRKRGAEKPRDQVMTDEELRRFWHALEGLDEHVRQVLKLLLLLGRHGFLTIMRRGHFSCNHSTCHFERGTRRNLIRSVNEPGTALMHVV